MRIKKLNEIERELWVNFHRFAYKDDLAICERVIEVHPRWAIISGYYAMHDIAKLYLGKVHGIKITGANIHKKVFYALRDLLGGNKNVEKIISLLGEAEEKIKELGIDDISYLLRLGEKERSKVQYYTLDSFSNNEKYIQKAKSFLEEIVLVFVKIMEEIVNAG